MCGAADGANPQTAPRVTVTGIAEVADDAALKSRYLAVHPYASLYADFGDFHLWRIRPMAALFVGGFARAVRLRQDELAPDPVAVAAIAEAEAGIISHCNNDHPDALSAIAGGAGDWRMVTADVDGTDLAQSERVLRIHWSVPVSDSGGVRTELVRMTREAQARGAA
jgi:putative heme iron utilization protein